ncbi:MAG TPA: OmpA family protein [Ohtaekwangia sp.]|nr:OmpA family protein [Ohtaekwangia sp.]
MKLKITLASLVVLAQALSAQPLNTSAFVRTNSQYDELNPVISPDGKTLYVTIANHPDNLGGRKDPGDIWYAVIQEDNTWSTPMHAGSIINDRSFNSIAGFSTDGKEAFVMNHFDSNGGTARTQGIAVTHGKARAWSKPENITIPYFKHKGGALSGYLSPDKKHFVFSAETYGSRGVEDIYITQRDSQGKWSEPKNVGSKINTQFQELSPSLSYDGKTLFFSSNGRKGNGSFDVYSATRLDDTWQNWSEPVNMGSAINSEGRDLYYREYPLLGFSLYTSTKNSDGYGDIRMHISSEQPLAIDSAVVASTQPLVDTTTSSTRFIEPEEDPARNHSVRVHGKVVNAKTGEAIPATITFEAAGDDTPVPVEKIKASPVQGYSLGVDTDATFKVKIESAGFISSIENLDVKTYEMNELEMNFNLEPIAVGTTVNLKDVLFEQSKTTLLPQSYPQLDMIVSFLKENPNVRIELSGHTDNRGIPTQNVKLSQARVDRVKDYLLSKGIQKKRVTGKGYGGSKPIANNDDEETRKLNRRVEFTIRKN